MADLKDKQFITSKEVLSKTGISRATLNNYIKIGILPRPVVKKADEKMQGIKHIGYFPESVLEIIDSVKQSKQKGEAMENIARKIKESSIVEMFPPSEKSQTNFKNQEAQFGIEYRSVFVNEEDFQNRRRSIEPERNASASFESGDNLTLTITKMDLPAYLVNHNFEVEWVNSEAERIIFNRQIRALNDIESRNIFKLFFGFEFHANISNFKEVIALHMPFVRSRFAKNQLSKLYQGISETEVAFLQDMYEQTLPFDKQSFFCFPIKLAMKDGTVSYFQVYSMFFREGIFFVYAPGDRLANEVAEYLSRREVVINELLRHRMPALVSLCVLVADLQDSVKISAELLPGEYFSLINSLWETLAGCFEKYGGIYGKHAGDGMLYYFIKKPGTNYIMNSINCALELREKMKEFSSNWKIKKGWLEDMYLNIGINEGQEYFGTIRSAPSVEFTALGDSINYAARLSDFARYGEIWTTKSVIGKLEPDELKRIQFGINRKVQGHTRFAPNGFSRVIDIMEKDDKHYGKFIDIATLPITLIIDRIERE